MLSSTTRTACNCFSKVNTTIGFRYTGLEAVRFTYHKDNCMTVTTTRQDCAGHVLDSAVRRAQEEQQRRLVELRRQQCDIAGSGKPTSEKLPAALRLFADRIEAGDSLQGVNGLFNELVDFVQLIQQDAHFEQYQKGMLEQQWLV